MVNNKKTFVWGCKQDLNKNIKMNDIDSLQTAVSAPAAIDNNMMVINTNNPWTQINQNENRENEETAVVELDLQKTDFYRTHWPFMRDRRIDSYQPITQRFIDEEK